MGDSYLNNSSSASTSTYSNQSRLQYEDGYQSIMDVAYFLNEYYLWVVFAIGFPGNLATIITIVRMRSLGSFTLYVVILAMTDNLAICLKLTFYQLLRNTVNIGTAGCRIFNFFGNFFVTSANWVLVIMAVERLLAVRYPLKIQKLMNCKRSAVALTIVGTVIATVYVPILWLVYYDDYHQTCIVDQSSVRLVSYLQWANVSMFAFIPFSVLTICNLLIVRVIKESFRVRSALRSMQQTVALKPKSSLYKYDVFIQRQIMLMLFTSTLVFVLLLFPICAFNVADPYWEDSVRPRSREYAIKYLIFQLTYILCDSTHAVNFYLYFLSARKFRRHFLAMSSCGAPFTRAASL
ncbi:thyrotropin-releasing hormone receptor [Plakobranchus ocellatus]|uniref:Thyrotropin-releasing hormone receptor n=1 Tax=Plakobranchus ocellatus TaxID=259542 RepID=A0AAV3YD79_9GAST|nr:thyrotropin-releasing hormone receptor [Plakobranchus ocellatus]